MIAYLGKDRNNVTQTVTAIHTVVKSPSGRLEMLGCTLCFDSLFPSPYFSDGLHTRLTNFNGTSR
jgi:hypothetical protein